MYVNIYISGDSLLTYLIYLNMFRSVIHIHFYDYKIESAHLNLNILLSIRLLRVFLKFVFASINNIKRTLPLAYFAPCIFEYANNSRLVDQKFICIAIKIFINPEEN